MKYEMYMFMYFEPPHPGVDASLSLWARDQAPAVWVTRRKTPCHYWQAPFELAGPVLQRGSQMFWQTCFSLFFSVRVTSDLTREEGQRIPLVGSRW